MNTHWVLCNWGGSTINIFLIQLFSGRGFTVEERSKKEFNNDNKHNNLSVTLLYTANMGPCSESVYSNWYSQRIPIII